MCIRDSPMTDTVISRPFLKMPGQTLFQVQMCIRDSSWTFFFSASSFFMRDVSVFIFSFLVPVNEVAVAYVFNISLLIWAIADYIPAKSFCVVCRAFNWLASFSVPNKRLILAVRLFRLQCIGFRIQLLFPMHGFGQ